MQLKYILVTKHKKRIESKAFHIIENFTKNSAFFNNQIQNRERDLKKKSGKLKGIF